MAQNRSHAVMAQRAPAPDSLDFFPTPPWATRALCEFLDRWGRLSDQTCWEPACGEGHMVRPLGEWFRAVHGSDVRDYGAPEQDRTGDFLWPATTPPHFDNSPPDWIITNPPFRLAEEFALRAFEVAIRGVALLVRTAFLEGGGRFERLFAPHRPEWILQFCERVPMLQGRLDPAASSATAYCWVVWTSGLRRNTPEDPRDPSHFPAFWWLPACRRRLERAEDYPATVSEAPPMPLFGGAS